MYKRQVTPNRAVIDVYLEVGRKRVFAGAVDWAGWCRSGRTEETALEALAHYGRRYAAVVSGSKLGFSPPRGTSAFTLVERVKGDASTDFGAPSIAPAADSRRMDGSALARARKLLQACWTAFDGAVEEGTGKELRKGPRGGGRDLPQIAGHVIGADAAYLGRLGTKFRVDEEGDPLAELPGIRSAILETLSSVASGGVPSTGPRGGARWTPRYFVRRSAWHVLDHAWEIEDRITGPTAGVS